MWCKVKGLIPPDYYDPPKSVTPDLGASDGGPVPLDDAGSGNNSSNGSPETTESPTSDGGCSLGSHRQPGWPLLLLLLLPLARRRRRQRTA